MANMSSHTLVESVALERWSVMISYLREVQKRYKSIKMYVDDS